MRGVGEGDWMREGEEISVRVTHGHRQQCGDGLREGNGGWEVGKGENGDIKNIVNNKNKKERYNKDHKSRTKYYPKR